MTTPETYLSHSDALRSRCDRILRDITETQQGLGKEWKNVQPCVLHASQLLLQQAKLHDERLIVLEEKMDQVLNAVEVIASDSRLKEQRYRLDREATERAVEELQRNSQKLHDAIETERRATFQFREEILYPGLADLQQQIERITPAVHLSQSPVRAQHPPAPSLSLSPPPPPLPVSVACPTMDADRRGCGDNPLLKEILQEVNLLRNQWQQLQSRLQSHSAAPALMQRVEEKRTASPPAVETSKKRMLSLTRPWVDCSVARWQWHGGQLSTSMLLADSPILWSTLRVRKTATGEWFSVGATSDGTLVHSALHDVTGLPFVWRPQRPSIIELTRGGVYRVTVCLLSSCVWRPGGKSQTGEPPSVTLRVNDNSVFSFFAGGSSCYTLHAPKAGGRGAKSARPAAHDKCAAARESSAGHRRPCGCDSAPTTVTSSSFSDFLRLPAGATVSVHCHRAASAGAVPEAFLEIELIAE